MLDREDAAIAGAQTGIGSGNTSGDGDGSAGTPPATSRKRRGRPPKHGGASATNGDGTSSGGPPRKRRAEEPADPFCKVGAFGYHYCEDWREIDKQNAQAVVDELHEAAGEAGPDAENRLAAARAQLDMAKGGPGTAERDHELEKEWWQFCEFFAQRGKTLPKLGVAGPLPKHVMVFFSECYSAAVNNPTETVKDLGVSSFRTARFGLSFACQKGGHMDVINVDEKLHRFLADMENRLTTAKPESKGAKGPVIFKLKRNYRDFKLCPVYWLMLYLTFSKVESGPLFPKLSSGGAPLTERLSADDVSKIFSEMINGAFPDDKRNFTTHSPRRSMAKLAVILLAQEHEIKAAGRWTSEVYKPYIGLGKMQLEDYVLESVGDSDVFKNIWARWRWSCPRHLGNAA
ncbi:hypothetical protein DFJ74DRAFT_705008 [Hyaloraphidium curvatum]|nr:hypothetical protein DFJ74DRAFT_705008 [Hyaloraphidium curvatum]